MLTKCLALEYGSSGILCVSVDPGCVTPPLGQGTVSDRRCRATLAWQRPMGIPSWGVPSLGRPFLGTSFPMVIPSQGHPFPPASLPVNIPSQGLPFPGASLPRCTHPCAAPGSQESCTSAAKGQFQALPPKKDPVSSLFISFPISIACQQRAPWSCAWLQQESCTQGAASSAPQGLHQPKFSFSDLAKSRQARLETSSLLQHSWAGLTPTLACGGNK